MPKIQGSRNIGPYDQIQRNYKVTKRISQRLSRDISQNKLEVTNVEVIMLFFEDILRYIEDKEEEEEYKANQ